jgi:hypothetical protein
VILPDFSYTVIIIDIRVLLPQTWVILPDFSYTVIIIDTRVLLPQTLREENPNINNNNSITKVR